MNTITTPPFTLADAFAALQSGQLTRAESMARDYLVHAPGDHGGLTLLGMSLQLQQRPAEAAQVYQELTNRFPAISAHWNNLGNALRESGQYEAAGEAFRRGLALAPRDATLHLNYGWLCMDLGQVIEAREHFIEASALDPSNASARIFGARTSHDCGDNETAEELLKPWREWRGLDAVHQLELGWMLIALGQVEDGEHVLREALKTAPDTRRVRARLVALLERMNRLDEAREEFRALPQPESIAEPEIREEVVNARVALALRDADPEQARAMLVPLADEDAPPLRRASFYFALAKVCDRQNDFDAAIDALRSAHDQQMITVGEIHPELVAPDAQPLYTAAVLLDPTAYAKWPELPAPSRQDSPVFIVGFPRSGTTMLEQMLDAHPQLKSMDERAFIQGVVERLPVEYPGELYRLDARECDRLRADYWTMVASCVQLSPGQRLVDKNPLNLLRLPMIQRIFPSADIILALRHPCDVLLSCYMQYFRTPHFASLCKSIDSLARGYAGAMKSWIHHSSLMQPHAMTLRYEDLLDDFAGNAERIGAFLGLTDTAPMLTFHEHAQRKGFISTPSYAQVIQPPHKKSVGRWQCYRSLFDTALPTLKPMLDRWGYAE